MERRDGERGLWCGRDRDQEPEPDLRRNERPTKVNEAEVVGVSTRLRKLGETSGVGGGRTGCWVVLVGDAEGTIGDPGVICAAQADMAATVDDRACFLFGAPFDEERSRGADGARFAADFLFAGGGCSRNV